MGRQICSFGCKNFPHCIHAAATLLLHAFVPHDLFSSCSQVMNDDIISVIENNSHWQSSRLPQVTVKLSNWALRYSLSVRFWSRCSIWNVNTLISESLYERSLSTDTSDTCVHSSSNYHDIANADQKNLEQKWITCPVSFFWVCFPLFWIALKTSGTIGAISYGLSHG